MTPKRVLVDGFFYGKSYGFGRFIVELCRALGNTPSEIHPIIAVPSRLDASSLPPYPHLSWHFLPDTILPAWEQVLIPRAARRLGCGAIHFPCNTRALLTRGLATVTTVHDLLFLDEHVSPRRYKDFIYSVYSKLTFRAGTAASDRIVAVSDTTRRALAARGLAAVTVPNTVDGFVRAHTDVPPAHRQRRYVLHRGGYSPHRNTGRVIEAVRAVRSGLTDLDLMVLGAPDGAQVWNTRAEPDIQFLPRVADRDLASLYKGSLCVVATSLQEGFGLPILEGFAFGSPVITSNRDPMREVSGDAAFLVDPTDIDAIAGAIRAIACDSALRQALIARGHQRCQAFSGSRVAEGMHQVYRSVLTARSRSWPSNSES